MMESLAVGHQPKHSLSPQDDALFRAFQSNLLSLISHELRTPLMGVINALTLLEQKEQSSDFSKEELIAMAQGNALRLQRSLASLLDLVAIESGTFHAKLREIDLGRLIKSRSEINEPLLKNHKIILNGQAGICLADPQKLSRALDLCFQIVVSKIEKFQPLYVELKGVEIQLKFQIQKGHESLWDEAWSKSLMGFQSGVTSPTSAFSEAVQSEKDFLTRTEEGLGSELLLIHEIMRLHQGKFESERKCDEIHLRLKIPQLSSVEILKAVLASRTEQLLPEKGSLSSLSLGMIEIPKKYQPGKYRVEEFTTLIKKGLFRASDSVYALPEQERVALVLEDCKPQDTPKLLERLEKTSKIKFRFGLSSCPEDSLDPSRLIEIAEQRMK